MTSIREHILATIANSLTAGSIGAPVYRSRKAPLARDESPAVIVEPVSIENVGGSVPFTDWELTVSVAVIARGEIPDQIADPIATNIHRTIMANPSVSGYAYDVQAQSSSWELQEADKDACVLVNLFVVKFQTEDGDIGIGR